MISLYPHIQPAEGESRGLRRFLQSALEIFSIDLALKREFTPNLKPEPLSLPGSSVEDAAHSDLTSMITKVLLEHEELTQLTTKLMQSRNGEAEIEGLMRKFLPFLDSLERILYLARDFPPSDEITNWLTGVESLYYRLLNTLEKYGLLAIESLDRPVNLDYQEVVEYITTSEHPHHHVIKERQKGYKFRGRLLRDAQVVVANNPQRS